MYLCKTRGALPMDGLNAVPSSITFKSCLTSVQRTQASKSPINSQKFCDQIIRYSVALKLPLWPPVQMPPLRDKCCSHLCDYSFCNHPAKARIQMSRNTTSTKSAFTYDKSFVCFVLVSLSRAQACCAGGHPAAAVDT